MTQKLIDAVLTNDKLFKLKLSRVNLNDNKIVDKICSMIYSDENADDSERLQLKQLFSLDLSWASLSPKHLCRIVEAMV